MMSITCHNLDLGRTVLDLVACGCSSSSSFDRSSVRNYSKHNSKGSSRGYGVRRLVTTRWERTLCRVSSMKTAKTLLDGKNEHFFSFWVGFFFFCHLSL